MLSDSQLYSIFVQAHHGQVKHQGLETRNFCVVPMRTITRFRELVRFCYVRVLEELVTRASGRLTVGCENRGIAPLPALVPTNERQLSSLLSPPISSPGGSMRRQDDTGVPGAETRPARARLPPPPLLTYSAGHVGLCRQQRYNAALHVRYFLFVNEWGVFMPKF